METLIPTGALDALEATMTPTVAPTAPAEATPMVRPDARLRAMAPLAELEAATLTALQTARVEATPSARPDVRPRATVLRVAQEATTPTALPTALVGATPTGLPDVVMTIAVCGFVNPIFVTALTDDTPRLDHWKDHGEGRQPIRLRQPAAEGCREAQQRWQRQRLLIVVAEYRWHQPVLFAVSRTL